MKKTFVLLISTVLLMSGCATIFTGTRDKITFNTTPRGATIYIDGVEQCTTPCSLDIRRKLDYTDVEVKLDGFQTRYITLSKSFNIISVINLGNVFGWGIDLLSGAVLKYDQKTYNLKLDQRDVSMIQPSRVNIDTHNNVVELYVMEKE